MFEKHLLCIRSRNSGVIKTAQPLLSWGQWSGGDERCLHRTYKWLPFFLPPSPHVFVGYFFCTRCRSRPWERILTFCIDFHRREVSAFTSTQRDQVVVCVWLVGGVPQWDEGLHSEAKTSGVSVRQLIATHSGRLESTARTPALFSPFDCSVSQGSFGLAVCIFPTIHFFSFFWVPDTLQRAYPGLPNGQRSWHTLRQKLCVPRSVEDESEVQGGYLGKEPEPDWCS